MIATSRASNTNMADVVTALDDRWGYNVRGRLTTERDMLVDDLASDDEETRQEAEAGLLRLLGWFCPTPQPVRREERLQRLEERLKGPGMSVAQRRKVAFMASRSTGRDPGRPWIKGPDTVRAFMLHLMTGKTWREIAFEIDGACEHTCLECRDVPRPRPEAQSGLRRRQTKARCLQCGHTIRLDRHKQRVCYRCADAVRERVGHLEKDLRRMNLYPTLPRRKVLNGLSSEEIEGV